MDELLEAYLGIYEDDSWKERNFKPLSDTKKSRVKNFLNRQLIKMTDYTNQADIAKKELQNPDYSKPQRVKIGPLLKKMKTGSRLMSNAQQARDNTIKHEIKDKKDKLASLEGQNNIKKFNREELEYILDILVSEGFVTNYDEAACIIEAMSDEWIEDILMEAPFDIVHHGSTIDGTKVGPSEPKVVKTYKNKTRAKNKAEEMNQEYGAHAYSVRKTAE